MHALSRIYTEASFLGEGEGRVMPTEGSVKKSGMGRAKTGGVEESAAKAKTACKIARQYEETARRHEILKEWI